MGHNNLKTPKRVKSEILEDSTGNDSPNDKKSKESIPLTHNLHFPTSSPSPTNTDSNTTNRFASDTSAKRSVNRKLRSHPFQSSSSDCNHSVLSAPRKTPSASSVKQNSYHSSASLLSPLNSPYKNYTNPLKQSSQLDSLYAKKTLTILSSLFPKSCNCSNPNLLFFKVKNRPTVSRCSNCHKQVSLTSNTPLQDFKLPLSYFSYILEDQILSYPKSVTSKEISKKLNIPYKSAYYLKRRLQIVYSLLNEKLQKQLFIELKEHNDKNPLKLSKNEDLRETIKNEPIAVADSVVLYSSSLRANKHRSRRYKTGSSSIYLSNSLGGGQAGVLVHTVGINHGMTFYKSIPLNNQEYLGKDLDEKIPKNTILFTDEGYTFIWDRKNHKMVNHSKRSNDPRYNLSRERWITKQGVSSNGAEARNNLLKQSFRSYSYVSPKWSNLYLSEFSFLGNVRFADELKNLLLGSGGEIEIVRQGDTCYSRYNLDKNFKISDFVYVPLTIEERTKFKNTKLINNYKEDDIKKYNKDYRSAILHNNYYWQNFYEKDRMRNEVEYNHRAFKILSLIESRKWFDVDSISRELELDKREVLFIIRKWEEYGIAEIIERKERYRLTFKLYFKNVKLYYLLYSNFKGMKENGKI